MEIWISPILGVAMLSYAGYCTAKGGMYVKGKGWMYKEEAPKSYITNQVIWYILGFACVFGGFIRKYLI